MTNKQRILHMVERWPEDISYDEALYHVYVLKKIDAGLKDIEAGRVFDDDEVFDELERLSDEEKNQGSVVGRSPTGSASAAKKRLRSGRPADGKVLRAPPKKSRKQSA